MIGECSSTTPICAWIWGKNHYMIMTCSSIAMSDWQIKNLSWTTFSLKLTSYYICIASLLLKVTFMYFMKSNSHTHLHECSCIPSQEPVTPISPWHQMHSIPFLYLYIHFWYSIINPWTWNEKLFTWYAFSSQMYETDLGKTSMPESKSPFLLDNLNLLWLLWWLLRSLISQD